MNILFKIIFQILFALAILPLSVWLFTLIPTPLDMTPRYGALGLVVYPFALAFYVSAVGILAVSTWNLIAFIFKYDDVEDEYQPKSVTATASKHKKYNYQPSLKQQTESLDTVAQVTGTASRPAYIIDNKKYNYQPGRKQKRQSLDTAVQITGLAPNRATDIPKKNDGFLVSTFRVASWIVGISFALASVPYVFFAVISLISDSPTTSRHQHFIAPYSISYKTEDYNDSRIIAYKHALEDASKQLIDSENMYDAFKADTKIKIALECISVFIKEYNTSKANSVHVQLRNFKLNARNKQTTTDDIIKKSIKSENFLGDVYKIYDYHVFKYSFDSSNLNIEDSCEKEIPIDVIFKKFMSLYISRQEKEIDGFSIREFRNASAKKHLEKQIEWLKILHEKNPKMNLSMKKQ